MKGRGTTPYAVEREHDGPDAEWMWACVLCAHTGWSLLSREGAVREADRHQQDTHVVSPPARTTS